MQAFLNRMKILTKYLLLGTIFILSLSFSNSNPLSESEANLVFNRVVKSVNSIQTMKFTLNNEERIGKSMMKGTQKVSMNVDPFQCHITMIEPGKGEELVYAGKKYDYQAIYEPAGFPYFQIELDPYGPLMRKNNHHTIFDLGYGKMMSILQYHMKAGEYKMTVSEMLRGDKGVYKIEIEFINFKYYNLKIDRVEKLTAFANRLYVNDYMLSELNDIDLGDDLKVGSIIKVPNAYAKKIELYIDKANGLPLSQIVYDEIGVYEKYDFSDLKINISIPEKRFESEMLGKTI